MMLEALALAAWLAGGFADPPAGPEPEPVRLGLDCGGGVDGNGDARAYAVLLPDDVLTECE